MPRGKSLGLFLKQNCIPIVKYHRHLKVIQRGDFPMQRWLQDPLAWVFQMVLAWHWLAKWTSVHHRTYVLMGDSELSEGSIWEAAELSAYYKLDHLVGIVDCNGLGQTGQTMHGHHADRYAKKFEAFGWDTSGY